MTVCGKFKNTHRNFVKSEFKDEEAEEGAGARCLSAHSNNVQCVVVPAVNHTDPLSVVW